jgi:hypothetical protein
MVFKKVNGVKYTKMRNGGEFKSPDSKTAFDALLDSKSEITKEEYDNPQWKDDSYFR